MLDWINDVPDVVWGAVVTGLFLTGQQYLNNRRDDMRRTDDAAERAKDREHQTNQAKAERDHAADEAKAERNHQVVLAEAERSGRLEEIRLAQDQERLLVEEAAAGSRSDIWRDERRIAHLKLLPLLEQSLTAVKENWRKVEQDGDGKVVRLDEALDSIDNEARAPILAALADVQIVGSELSREKASACRQRLFDADVAIWAETGFGTGLRSYKDLEATVGRCEPAIVEYIDSVRKDLGTAD